MLVPRDLEDWRLMVFGPSSMEASVGVPGCFAAFVGSILIGEQPQGLRHSVRM